MFVGENNICVGITSTHNKCKKQSCQNSLYCDKHEYFKDLSDEIKNLINAKDESVKSCRRCYNWNDKIDPDFTICAKCLDENRNKKAEKDALIKASRVTCNYTKQDGTKCDAKMLNASDIYVQNILNNNISNEDVRQEMLNHIYVCKVHLQERINTMLLNKQFDALEDYATVKKCTGCNNNRPLIDFESKHETCRKCCERTKKIRELERTRHIQKCAIDTCVLPALIDDKHICVDLLEIYKIPKVYRNFCYLHQLEGLCKEMFECGKKVCMNFIHGCRSEINFRSRTKKCENCLVKNRKGVEEVKEVEKIMMCKKCIDVLPISNFIDRFGNKSDHCMNCLLNKNSDERGNHELEQIQLQLKKLNKPQYEYDRTINVQRLINKFGMDGYRKYQAMKRNRYFLQNPGKRMEQNERNNKSISVLLSRYKRDAKDRDKLWELTDEHAILLFSNKCYYCHETPLKEYFNGIDRKNNDIGYNVDNCVSCCMMCNFMKTTNNDITYVNKINHILSMWNLVDESVKYRDDNLFKDHSCSYNGYRHSAFIRNLKFDITQHQFNIITSMDCYLCGKKTTYLHHNGIDRVDNEICYQIDNLLPCCGDCNYMKFIHNIYDVFIKMLQIHVKHILSNPEKKILYDKVTNMLQQKFKEVNIAISISSSTEDKTIGSFAQSNAIEDIDIDNENGIIDVDFENCNKHLLNEFEYDNFENDEVEINEGACECKESCAKIIQNNKNKPAIIVKKPVVNNVVTIEQNFKKNEYNNMTDEEIIATIEQKFKKNEYNDKMTDEEIMETLSANLTIEQRKKEEIEKQNKIKESRMLHKKYNKYSQK